MGNRFAQVDPRIDGYDPTRSNTTLTVYFLVSQYIRVRKIDSKTAVIAKDRAIFDVPVYREKEYDYDESDGVIDEYESVVAC